MAGLCVEGHFALTSSPVLSVKRRELHGVSSSTCRPFNTITAKAGPKLVAKEPKQAPKSKQAPKTKQAPGNISFSADINGKQVNITLLQDVQTNAPNKAGKIKQQSLNSRVGVELDVQAGRATRADKETYARDVKAADDDMDTDNEGAEESEDTDEEESNDDQELEEVLEMFVPPGAALSPEKSLPKLPGSNIYLGPHAIGGKLKEVEFVKSSTSVADCPPRQLPEFAMVGRSNVGKSSLINSLVQRKSLALTSKKPGRKTQLINHFIVNKSWYLVDLPGYGFANSPASVRASWDNFTKDFFLQSKTLVCVMLLVDASIPPQQIDLDYADWLHQNKVPMTLVFTKCDRKKKIKNGGRKPVENMKDFLRSLKEKLDKPPPWIMTSCVTNQGKDGLLLHMAQLRNFWSS
ncbi:hypothetical protein L7F22_042343 [Adiantum nelumboides]|nr:hypothetical protein [Adiantum nelumboides]